MKARADLLVVGGGPAGLSVAIRARQAGLTTLVVDRARPPVDKPCGEGLMPDGVGLLEELGIDVARLEGWPFRGIRYLDGERVAEGRFPEGSPPGLGMRRVDLHRALARRAREVGVELCWGLRVTGLTGLTGGPDGWGVATEEGEIGAPWLVAADGLRSRLRRWAGLEVPPARRRRFGVRRHYRLEPWSDCVEVYWGEGAEAYVTPVGPRTVGVAVLWSERKAGFDDLLALFPPLAARLRGAPTASRDLGTGPLEQRVRAVVRGRLALVGDASGYVDALTGEGLSLAFHQGRALVEAVVAGDLRRYAAAHRRIGRLPDSMTRLLLAVEARPWLRRRTVSALAADPALFSRLLAIHARRLPLAGLGAGGVVRLVRGLVAARV